MCRKLFLIIVVTTALLQYVPAESDGCSADCGELPSKREYHCYINNSLVYLPVYPGCQKVLVHDPQHKPCVAYAGMEIHMYCSDNSTLHRYGNADSLGIGTSHVFAYARREDGGLYECRHENGSLHGQRNLTIRVEPVIAFGPQEYNSCSFSFYCRSVSNGETCCKPLSTSWIPASKEYNIFSISVYGEEPLAISVETIWNESNHYPVDLGIEVLNSSDSTKVAGYECFIVEEPLMMVKRWPATVDEEKVPSPIILVNASNSYGHSTTCFSWALQVMGQAIFANSSLPKNQTVLEGQSAVFACHIGTSEKFLSSIDIDYRTASGQSPQITCKDFDCSCEDDDCPITIQRKPMNFVRALTTYYYYDIQISDVTLNDSGSSVSCALWYDGAIQWKQEAWLTVHPKPLSSGTSDQSDEPNVQYTVAPILFVVVVAVVISLCGVFLVRWRNRRKRTILLMEPDRVPLRDATESVTATPVDNLDVSMEFTRAYTHVPPLPSIEVTGSYPPARLSFQQNRIDARALHTSDTPSIDSGVVQCGSQSSSLEEVSCNLPTLHLVSHNLQVRRGSNDLQVRRGSNDQLDVNVSSYNGRSHSLSDLRLHIPFLQNGSPPVRRKTRVYVSYTDRKIVWVIEFLKPLIESFQNTVVTVHDADMIAGHPISEERLRLILEADKVIVLCSPDYSSSEWCKYELYQAITKQPSLADGKIIPILCDGCNAAPDVIRGVVFVRDTDELFERKLRAALFRAHRPSC